MIPSEFLDFIDSLNSEELKNIVKEHKESNQLNFVQAILEYLDSYDIRTLAKDIIEKIIKKIGVEYFDYLMDKIVDKRGYINLPVLEVLGHINPEKIKIFLDTSEIRVNLRDDNYILLNFHRILNSLLVCFNPEEVILFLENNIKDDFLRIILPKLKIYKSLYMSERKERDMSHYITAFLLEEVKGDIYFENLRIMGGFLEDIFLSELFDEKGEVIVDIKEILYYAEEVRPKLSTVTSHLFDKEEDYKKDRRHCFY